MRPGGKRKSEELERERRLIEEENAELLCRLQAVDRQLEAFDAQAQQGAVQENGLPAHGGAAQAADRAARRRIVNGRVVRDRDDGQAQRWIINGRIIRGGTASRPAPDAASAPGGPRVETAANGGGHAACSLSHSTLLDTAMVPRACRCMHAVAVLHAGVRGAHGAHAVSRQCLPLFRAGQSCSRPELTPRYPWSAAAACLLCGPLRRHCHRSVES